MTENELKEIANQILKNTSNKVEAVSEFRNRTLFSLKDSKFYIEKHQKELNSKKLTDINVNESLDDDYTMSNESFLCPRCKSSNVNRKEVGKHNSGWFWPMIFIFSILGISVNPIVLLLAILIGIVNFIVNIVEKKRDKKQWLMFCNTCNNEFFVDAIEKNNYIVKKER